MTPALARTLRSGRFLLGLTALAGCAPDQPPPDVPFGGPSPWPSIRETQVRELLPAAMTTAGVDAWIVLVRENANDPLALHVGGENAGAPSAILFFRQGNEVRSTVLSGFGEAVAHRGSRA